MQIEYKPGNHMYCFIVSTKTRRIKSILVQATSVKDAQQFVRELYPGSSIVSRVSVDEIYSIIPC